MKVRITKNFKEILIMLERNEQFVKDLKIDNSDSVIEVIDYKDEDGEAYQAVNTKASNGLPFVLHMNSVEVVEK